MSSPAALLTAAHDALAGYVELSTDGDGALTFLHSDVPCVIQATELAAGLDVLSVTCVLAWDLPRGAALAVASPWLARRCSSVESASPSAATSPT